ncbi:MAG: iron ABC transporter permease [Deltaproteobacteria bacterium]|nr:iron ABC transporter permease [Deltaproteobacteria bacterium]
MRRWCIINGCLLLGVALAALVALNLGPEPVTVWSTTTTQATASAILWSARLPRILLALVVGVALGSAGSAYQALLRNPLADPYILGVSGGAALGSAVVVALGFPFIVVAGAAFAASLASMVSIYRFAARPGRTYTHALLLTGVVFNAFAFASIMGIHTVVPMQRAHEILFLLMGNLALGEPMTTAGAAIAVGLGWIVLMVRSRAMNALVLGEETAASLGVNCRRLQWEVFAAGSLMIGATVAVSGLIGFVGLFIPHATRLLWGSDHRLVIPAAGLLGAMFLLLADTLARTVLTGATYQTELPVGVITALVGAPCFVWLLRKQL